MFGDFPCLGKTSLDDHVETHIFRFLLCWLGEITHIILARLEMIDSRQYKRNGSRRRRRRRAKEKGKGPRQQKEREERKQGGGEGRVR